MLVSISGKLRSRPVLRQVMGNTAWLVGDRVWKMGIGFFLSVWIARYLGPQDFGLFNYAIALTSLFGVLATLGLESVVVRDLVREPALADQTLGTAFLLRSAGGVLATAMATTVAFALNRHTPLATLLVFLISLPLLFRGWDVINLYFQAHLASRYTVLASNVAFTVVSIYKVVLVMSHASLVAFALADLLMAGVVTASLLVAARRSHLPRVRWRFDRARCKQLLADSWPLALSGLAIMIYMRIDQVMLERMTSSAEVGRYSAAIKLTETWYFIPMAVGSSVLPKVVELSRRDPAVFAARMQQLYDAMTAVALAVALPVSLLAEQILRALYGARYAGAGSILSLHVWAAVFVFWGVIQEPWMVARGLQTISMRRTMLGAIINIALNLWLIPRMGAVGAAVATVCSYATAAWLSNLFAASTRPMFWMQTRSLLSLRRLLRAARTPAAAATPAAPPDPPAYGPRVPPPPPPPPPDASTPAD